MRGQERGQEYEASEEPRYYDKEGKPITLEQWTAIYSEEYKRVAEDTLPNGMWVSTIWLGLDHGYGWGPPRIFETMVFRSKGRYDDDLGQRRYSTLEQAQAGHQEMVEKWSKEDK